MTTISHSVLLSGVGRTYGIIFDIIASPEVPGLSISGMDILIDSSTSEEYEIWTKDPSMLDFDLASFGSVVGRGMSKLARIPLGEFDDVLVPGGSARTVWVTLKSDRLFVQSHVRSGLVSTRQGIVSTSAEVGDDQIMASSDDGGLLSVLYGEAVDGYPINAAGDFTDHRGFLGRIYYAVTEEVESDMPSVQPSVSFVVSFSAFAVALRESRRKKADEFPTFLPNSNTRRYPPPAARHRHRRRRWRPAALAGRPPTRPPSRLSRLTSLRVLPRAVATGSSRA